MSKSITLTLTFRATLGPDHEMIYKDPIKFNILVSDDILVSDILLLQWYDMAMRYCRANYGIYESLGGVAFNPETLPLDMLEDWVVRNDQILLSKIKSKILN